jgi:phenylacetate-CoA ligase
LIASESSGTIRPMNPLLIEKVIYPAYRALKRDRVLSYLADARRVGRMEPDQIRDFQWRKISRLLAHAAAHVPYYREVFKDVGAEPGDFKRISDLVGLPILRKRDFRDRAKDLVSDVCPAGRLTPGSTSGSTGESLHFHYDAASSESRRASHIHMNQWLGIRIGEKTAYLWGTAFDVARSKRLAASLRSYLSNTLVLSAFTMDAASLKAYAAELARFRPKVFVSYPSFLVHFSKSLADRGEPAFSPPVILVSGETLFDWQRDIIERGFGAQVYNHYGCCEFGAMARECRVRNGLHLASERLLVETVPVGKSPGGGDVTELVITDLDNLGMPFIRYGIEDVGTITWAPCECGLTLPRLESALGRTFDVVRAPNGNFVGGTFWTILLKRAKGVERLQVIQEKIDAITIRVEATPEFSEEGRAYVLAKIMEACGPAMRVTLDHGSKIEMSPGGKHRLVISRIK